MSVRDNFASAYAAVWGCPAWQADGLLRQMEKDGR